MSWRLRAFDALFEDLALVPWHQHDSWQSSETPVLAVLMPQWHWTWTWYTYIDANKTFTHIKEKYNNIFSKKRNSTETQSNNSLNMYKPTTGEHAAEVDCNKQTSGQMMDSHPRLGQCGWDNSTFISYKVCILCVEGFECHIGLFTIQLVSDSYMK